MRNFGGAKTALHFRKGKKGGDAQGGEPQKYRFEEGDGTRKAQDIVRELYVRYEKQLQRWKDYRNLFSFLGFIALFLAVLYLQRDAQVSYQVYDTVDSVVVPTTDTMQDQAQVYDWLKKLLGEVWKDPVCGDGLCEAPFEFASYSRFGCRADCGKLSEVQNLTQIQVDIYFDFSHPVGSIPASDLMQQAKFNLCPVTTPYSGDCYYEEDISFERLSGSQSFVIDDAPDGDWSLVVRRDIFNKVRGGVRDTALMLAAAYYYKIYVAAAAARAEQVFEMDLLEQAVNITKLDFWTYANTTIRASYPNATEFEGAMQWVQNATCFCDSIANGTSVSDPVFGDVVLQYLNQSASYQDLTLPVTHTTQQLKADSRYCPTYSAGFDPREWKAGNDSSGNWTKTLETIDTTNQTLVRDWCRGGLALSLAWRDNMTQSVQRAMVERRAGDGKFTGKIASRNTVLTTLRTFLSANYPELVAPIYTNPTGTVALEDPMSAQLQYLTPLYVEGVKITAAQETARLWLIRRNVYNSTVHLLDLGPRAQARIEEVKAQQADVASIAIPAPMESYQNRTFFPSTVGDVYSAFVVAGATNATMPEASNSTLGQFAINYNLVAWRGNTTAYMRCGLDNRGPEYVGECVAMPVTCVSTLNDTAPYNCTDLLSGGAPIAGNLSDPAYRTKCETPCDRRLDCNTLCECYGTCSSTEYCECDACVQLNANAARDDQFVDIRAVVQDQAAASAVIADVDVQSVSHRRSRSRALLTTNEELAAQLSSVLTQVGTVSTQQTSIASQMTNLKAQVDRANQLAEARANDKRLEELIAAGRADIQAGQARVESKLDEIIGKQNQALAMAEDAAKSLSAIQGLAERQLAAQKALETAVSDQLKAVRVATYNGIITLTQALALWKRARRDRALTLKAAKLANIPCSSDPVVPQNFKLDNGNSVNTTTARERNVGLNNRVIAGLLLHQTRTNETLCPESKFDSIQKTCTGDSTVASYGVDPNFKMGTTLYDPNLNDVNNTLVVQWYNCSQLSLPTYNVTFLNQTVNPAPYCAELYNPQSLPYAFHYIPLENKDDGFPVYFDINLSEDSAQEWFTYISEGLYLDQRTSQLTAQLVTYNADLRIFSYYYLRFSFSDGGSIQVKHRLNTINIEMYATYSDDVRFGFEIILSMCIYGMMLYNLYEIAMTQRSRGNFLKYFLSGWHWVEFASNGLLTACMTIWWVWKDHYAANFDINLRYDVYQTLRPTANFLALATNGAGLNQVNDAFHELSETINMLNWYFALNGINILLLIARMLKLMDFQPRLGVVTRSLWLAGPDLIHFAIVAGMVFIGYAMMGHLIFGNAIDAFSSFGEAINTCFEILLGNIDVNDELRALGGLQSVAGALWFWTYELLVYMVLLNFLLAIIVDAFSEVKEKTHETVGIHTELFTLLRDKWRGLLGRCSPNYIDDSKLGELLRQWAGDTKDADGDAAGEKKPKLLTVLNEPFDEETLRDVLLECLHDAPDGGKGGRGAASAGFVSRLFGKNRSVGAGDADATEEEIKQAAKYIVERFGAAADADDEDDDDMPEPAAPLGAPAAAMALAGSAGGREAVLEKERDQLAQALERLAEVQRELAEGQRNLMSGQKQLAEQQSKLVQLMNEQPPGGN